MTLSLYSTYSAWRQDVEAERIEAAARRVIAPSAIGMARGFLGMTVDAKAGSDDESTLGIG